MEALLLTLDGIAMIFLCLAVSRTYKTGKDSALGFFDFRRDSDQG